MSESLPGHHHIVIIGLMGVGKSTTGRALAERLGRPYWDSDVDIERLTGVTGREFSQVNGIVELHRLEAAVLLGRVADAVPAVITAAASTVDDPLARSILADRATVVRLVLDLDQTIERQGGDGHRRPIGRSELEALASRREPLFTEVEDLRLRADQPVQGLVADIVTALS